jgi:phospholipase/carboxylesterase
VPGEEITPMPNPATADGGGLRDSLPFPYRIWRPERARGETLILLHGSGVDETTMEALGAEIAPDATRIAVRGRIPQEGGWRWFERITPIRFAQQSIFDEAAAFAIFLEALAAAEGFDLGRAVFVGYSNGANLISSVMLLNPGLIARAALLRSMPVLDEAPPTDLSGADVLVIAGERDVTYAPFAPALVGMLRGRGAEVEVHTVAAGHEFGVEDARLVREWLGRRTPATA